MKKADLKVPQLFRMFAPYFVLLKPVKWHFAGALIFGTITGAVGGFGFPFMAYKILPKVFGETPPTGWMLAGVVGMLPLAFLLKGVSQFFNQYLAAFCGARVLVQLQERLYRKLQELPLAFFGKSRIGDLMARVNGDATTVQIVVTQFSNELLKQPIAFIGAIGALIYMAVQKKEMLFILFALAIIPLCVLPIRYVGKRLLARACQLQDSAGNIATALNENLSAVREVRAFNLQERENTRFSALLNRMAVYTIKTAKYGNMLAPTIEWISACGVSGAIFYVARANMGIQDILPLLTALYMTYDPIKKLGAIHRLLKVGEASVKRIEYILHAEDTVLNAKNPVPFLPGKAGIGFENVTFAYADEPVLKNIDLTIPAGTTVALVGPSGAGKSTFVNLIPRFYDVDEGRIRIGGTDVRSYSKNDLRAHVSIVSQDTVLFNDTIRNNIRLGRQNATDAEVETAARHAFVHDFVTQFEEGYETMVGERGARLSGGQKQRIAIARAFLKNAPVLIMDEATSSLDSESEEKVQLALNELVQGKTVILIAHRFSTIRMADRIIVMENGMVRASGTHAELYVADALYKSLYDKQFIE
ncbi:MAG: ABC transporter ATP-binding protein [Kiritimatiellaceae bacterium]|nr:ABC transporter ATP-binding protein [Kiritimatiellaceae bacterium]